MKNDLLLRSLYSGKDIPDVIKKYEALLRANPTLKNINHANRLQDYRKMITNKELLKKIRKYFNEIYKIIDEQFKNLRFTIDGRRKSFISIEKKIIKLISDGRDLDSIRDTYAFRIILFGKDSYSLIKSCYDLANTIIEHSISKGLSVVECQVSETDQFRSEEHPKIIIPNESGLKKEYQSYAKDYFRHPKANGYQSLHLLFKATTGEYFEVQIRTFDMHVHAESGEASHEEYKNAKYTTSPEFDSSKVNIPGYGVSPEGKVYDFIGLEERLEILKRQKTY